jgi:ferredoxin
MGLRSKLFNKISGSKSGLDIHERKMEIGGILSTMRAVKDAVSQTAQQHKPKAEIKKEQVHQRHSSSRAVISPKVVTPVAKAATSPSVGGSGGGFAAAARAAAADGLNTSARLKSGKNEDGSHQRVLAIGEDEIDTTIHTADDGVEYWGRLDNESARDKAAGKILTIDNEECISCGNCVERSDIVFALEDDDEHARVVAQQGDMLLIEDAIDTCPTTCISWEKSA